MTNPIQDPVQEPVQTAVIQPPVSTFDQSQNVVVGKKNNTGSSKGIVLVLVAIIFLFIGLVGTIILLKSNSNLKDLVFGTDVTITPAISVTPTTEVNPTSTIQPTINIDTFHSEDLGITFTVPQGVTITQVPHQYNVNGCLSDTGYPTYNSIKATMNGKQILFIGVSGSCGADFIGDSVETVYTKTVSGVVYTLQKDRQNNGYMRIGVQFGSSSKVASPKVRSNDAIMNAEKTTSFTQSEFDAAVTIISSIVKD